MKDLGTFGMEELTEMEMVNIDGGIFNTPGYISPLEGTILVGMLGAAGVAAVAYWYVTGRILPGIPGYEIIKATYDEFMAA